VLKRKAIHARVARATALRRRPAATRRRPAASRRRPLRRILKDVAQRVIKEKSAAPTPRFTSKSHDDCIHPYTNKYK
jgi:hypothetical protein